MGRIPAQSLRRLRGRLAAEHGVTLIETLISAVILVMVLLAVMATLDTAASSTAANRGRTVAAGLAEQDQERMRGMRAADLSNYDPAPEVMNVGGVDYTVKSLSEWVRDSTGGAESCTADTKQADYMRITSTVTSPVIGERTKPVVLRSLVAPRVGSFGADQGTLAVKVVDGSGGPVVGMPVNIAGPRALAESTNDGGCAVFGYIPIGNYGITVSQPGFVDVSGRPQISTSMTVSPQTVQTKVLQYAQAATVTVNVTTKVGSATPIDSLARTIQVANPALPSPGMRLFNSTPVTGASAISAPGLFPFADGYSFYSGDAACADTNPTLTEADYFTKFGYAAPAAGSSAVVTVREPALNFQVLRDAVAYPAGHVVITPACGAKSTSNVLRGSAAAPAGTDSPSALNATLLDPGFPFGRYTICADDGSRYAQVTVASDSSAGLPLLPTGSPVHKLNILSAVSPLGRCT